MRAPPTQLRRLRPKHPSGNITQNLPPQIPQIPLKKLQLLPRRCKIQRIRHLQIHQPQLVRNHPLSPPPHQRIKPHLKLSLPTIPRQRLLPSLIIHHPHLTSRCHIHPINKPPHRHPIQNSYTSPSGTNSSSDGSSPHISAQFGRNRFTTAGYVRSGRSHKCISSKHACTNVPRTWATVFGSGNLSIARNRYNNGHCI